MGETSRLGRLDARKRQGNKEHDFFLVIRIGGGFNLYGSEGPMSRKSRTREREITKEMVL